MSRLTLTLSPGEAQTLAQICERESREPRMFAKKLLLLALAEADRVSKSEPDRFTAAIANMEIYKHEQNFTA